MSQSLALQVEHTREQMQFYRDAGHLDSGITQAPAATDDAEVTRIREQMQREVRQG